jgi:NADH-quinone oxidoreductase subunit E
MLTPEERAEIEAEMPHYPTKQAVCIDAMKMVQKRRGWLSDESLRDIAEFLGMTLAELDGVASFYNLLLRKPVGRNVIWICDSVSCWIMGYERQRAAIEQRLGIGIGQTTADNRFTLIPIVCLGCCDRAPAMLVNEDLHTNLTPGRIDSILEHYR